MNANSKYFIFNKERDYLDSHLEQMEFSQNGLTISPGVERGRFITRVLDSREKSMEWHRLEFNPGQQPGLSCKVSVYASDTLEFAWKGSIKQVEELIKDKELSYEEKRRELRSFLKKEWEGHRDLLLHEISGRYLWMAFEVYSQGKHDIDRLWNIQVYFPRKSWLSYLPEVYQAEDEEHFLERYLAVFQTLYEDVNREIRQLPFYLDADSTQEAYLTWLASWLDIAGSHMWSHAQLRSLLKQGVRLYQGRGTRECMLALIRLYTGGDCFLVEPYRLEWFMNQGMQKEDLFRLYGIDPYVLTVVVKKEDVPTQKEYKTLLRVIEEMKPVQMGLRLVVLEYFLFLGGYSYLGINSAVGEYRKLSLDGLAMLPFSALEKKTMEKDDTRRI